jgi:hypothetical protein
LMYWADTIGVAEVYRQIQAWHQQYGERWTPSPLLRRLTETGTPLREAKPGRPMYCSPPAGNSRPIRSCPCDLLKRAAAGCFCCFLQRISSDGSLPPARHSRCASRRKNPLRANVRDHVERKIGSGLVPGKRMDACPIDAGRQTPLPARRSVPPSGGSMQCKYGNLADT